LSDRGDVCAFSYAWGISAILEKAECGHIKAIAQAEATFSVDDTKDPSVEATLIGGKFYNDVWVNDGWELAHEIIKKSEKDTHDARAEAKRAEEAAERERRIGIIFGFLASVLALWLRTNQFFLLQLNYFAAGTIRSPSWSKNEGSVGHHKHGWIHCRRSRQQITERSCRESP
jgi:hypothetical protein